MKSYSVEYTDEALKALRKMDEHNRQVIYNWIGENLVGCENPRQRGKGLRNNLSGKWRYRVGDYRIIAEIEDARVLILIVDVGHRSVVYN